MLRRVRPRAEDVADHLDVVVLGPGDHQVLVASRLIHSQTHDWTKVTNQLPSRCKSEKKKI